MGSSFVLVVVLVLVLDSSVDKGKNSKIFNTVGPLAGSLPDQFLLYGRFEIAAVAERKASAFRYTH